MMLARHFIILILGMWLTASGCSAVQEVWQKPGYNPQGPQAIKRVGIFAAPSPAHPGLAQLLSQVATDRVKLKMNYLVYRSGVHESSLKETCATALEGTPPLEGILSLRPLHVTLGDEVELHLVAELSRCKDGELLWRAVGVQGTPAANEDLAGLTAGYIGNIGEHVQPYAAPAFLVLRDMLDQLPDVVLTDDEIIEKIELGSLDGSRLMTEIASRAP